MEWNRLVSMLTGGVDVKNVFHIRPPMSRGLLLNKLLIAQVLGRGLRIPKGLEISRCQGDQITKLWSEEIGNLLKEVLEVERHTCHGV